jgi:HAD superfamily hydrolase (TIGR01509 family)
VAIRFVDQFKAVLFDMNGYRTYLNLGGSRMTRTRVQEAVLSICRGLGRDYQDPTLFDSFPSLATAVAQYGDLIEDEALLIEHVIAAHEVGQVPDWAAATLRHLADTHTVGVVSNVWAKGHHWSAELRRAGVTESCRCIVFSSDLGCIKPSPRPFLSALSSLALAPEEVLFVGDSLERDVRPARSLGMATAWISQNGDREEADLRIGNIAELEMCTAPKAR